MGVKDTQKAREELWREPEFQTRQQGLWGRGQGKEAVWYDCLLPPPCPHPRTLLALGCHVGMADEKAEDNLKKTKLPKT